MLSRVGDSEAALGPGGHSVLNELSCWASERDSGCHGEASASGHWQYHQWLPSDCHHWHWQGPEVKLSLPAGQPGAGGNLRLRSDSKLEASVRPGLRVRVAAA